MYDAIGDMRTGTPGIHDVPLIDHCARFVVATRELSDGGGIYLVVLPGFIFSKLIRTDKVEATVFGVRAVEPCLVFCVPSTELYDSICLLHIGKVFFLGGETTEHTNYLLGIDWRRGSRNSSSSSW